MSTNSGPFTPHSLPGAKATGETAGNQSPRLNDQISRHAAKLALRNEQERIEIARKTAQVAVGMVELGPGAPVARLTFFLGLKTSTNDYNLPNTHAEHEQFLIEMDKLGYTLRCPEEDETIEYLIDSEGQGFERTIDNLDDSPVGSMYEDLMPVVYTVLRHPVPYVRTIPLSVPSPADPV